VHAEDYMCTNFDTDSSSHFFLEWGQTDGQIQLNARPHDGSYTASMGN